MMPLRTVALAVCSCVWLTAGRASEPPDIPADAPADSLMAGPAELEAMQDWARLAFTGTRPAARTPAIEVELRRQDYNVLRFGQSCMETPLRLGPREFHHGLGTHANSEIVLHLPEGARTFRAVVGVDNNYDTGGVRGSVQFRIEVAGREVLHTPTLRGSSAPQPVEVDLPAGTRELVLKVDTTPDGPAYDQADWADARVELADGRTVWADDDRPLFITGGPPFSFRYDGVASAALLPRWPRTVQTTVTPRVVEHWVSWTDPRTGLEVAAQVRAFRRYPAVEWLLCFTNHGTADTLLLEDIQALDVRARTGLSTRPALLHQLVGDVCGARSFLPMATPLAAGQTLAFAPSGGRSSNGAFPFFNLEYGGEGLITAVGWSGQWAAGLERAATGPTRLHAGQERTHLRLHPGEGIRSPRMLILVWRGDRMVAHNRFRRLLLFEYAPRQAGRPLRLPFALQCFDRYSSRRPDWGTEAGQLRAAQFTHAVGCDTHWLDAAWFPGGFPNGVGNWFPKPEGFPRGLRPLSDACHALGLKFLLWFEPERVAAGTAIAREHPEFVLGGSRGGLFKLNEPAAQQWLTDLLSQRITEFGLDTYRNDFNIDPLEFWRRNDAPDRQGMTEIRYVEGQYALWDGLRARHPGLMIDNCASGGRRIDLETCQRAVPLWRSDTGCSPGHPDWNQTQTLGLSLYVPLFTACDWSSDAYASRSAATAGGIYQFGFLDPGFSLKQAQAAVAEAKEDQKYWYGDFYPLTEVSAGEDAWAAWQLHRSDLQAGEVVAFRRAASPYPALMVALHALNPGATYAVDFVDEHRQRRQRRLAGHELTSGLELRLPRPGTSLLLRYRLAR